MAWSALLSPGCWPIFAPRIIAQAFGLRGHHAVFDAIINYFDKMPGVIRAAVLLTSLGIAAKLFPPRRVRGIADARSQRGKDGIETLNHL